MMQKSSAASSKTVIIPGNFMRNSCDFKIFAFKFSGDGQPFWDQMKAFSKF
jgi:hypothetical protein